MFQSKSQKRKLTAPTLVTSFRREPSEVFHGRRCTRVSYIMASFDANLSVIKLFTLKDLEGVHEGCLLYKVGQSSSLLTVDEDHATLSWGCFVKAALSLDETKIIKTKCNFFCLWRPLWTKAVVLPPPCFDMEVEVLTSYPLIRLSLNV